LEIESALVAGAQRLMLPMFRTPEEVEALVELVGGRAHLTLLVETPQALARLPAYLGMLKPGDLLHFGLNDLRIALGLDFLFEVVAGGFLEHATALCRGKSIPFGIGGIGRVGHGHVPAEMVMGELVRLGANWVILSRAFHGGFGGQGVAKHFDIREEMQKLQDVEHRFSTAADDLEENRSRFNEVVFSLGREARLNARPR
jgi:hypothetical protein